MKRTTFVLYIVLIALMCVACVPQNTSLPQNTQPLPIQTQNDPSIQQNKEFSYPLYFPMPYFRVFSNQLEVDNIDAFLHNAATNYYCALVDATDGTFLSVSLQLLDQWESSDDAVYFLCFMAEYDFPNLAEELTHNYSISDGHKTVGGTLIRFKVLTDRTHANHWGFQMQEILEESLAYDESTIRTMCNNRPIADEIIEFKNGRIGEPSFIRYILPEEYAHNKNAILKRYLETYFPDCFCAPNEAQ